MEDAPGNPVLRYTRGVRGREPRIHIQETLFFKQKFKSRVDVGKTCSRHQKQTK